MVALCDLLPLIAASGFLGFAWEMSKPLPIFLRILCSVTSAILGWIICRTFFFGLEKIREYKTKKLLRKLTLEQLTDMLEFASCFEVEDIIKELIRRNENIKIAHRSIAKFLEAEDVAHRYCAFRVCHEYFKEELSKRKDYNPFNKPEKKSIGKQCGTKTGCNKP